MTDKPRIAILTFCVGADYKRAMEPGLASKRNYAAKHGYDLHIGGEDVWDRSRPIPWSKFHFINKYLDDYDYLFWSDADAILLNQEIALESFLPLLPEGKDILWTYDACNHYNNGHLLIRGKSAWVRDYFQRAYAQTNLIHHIWWDNAAMIALFESNPADRDKIETCKEHWKFNAYVFGPNNSATDNSARLYKHGDFLIHFAGVYEPWNIYRMMRYAQQQYTRCLPLDTDLLDHWRRNPPLSKQEANDFFKDIQFDIVIPCAEKDMDSLRKALPYTRKNIIGYRNIYIITNHITSMEGCIIIPESMFPFKKEFISNSKPTNTRTGWYFQQLLKLYAGMYIPNILDRYLVLDSDMFFLKPTRFINDSNKSMYCVASEYHAPYFRHMARLHPSLIRVNETQSGIVHHMMFDTKYLKEMFEMVEQHHGGTNLFWELFIVYIDTEDDWWIHEGDRINSGSSEYEMYLNYMCAFHRDAIEIRDLKRGNEADWAKIVGITGHSHIDTAECITKHINDGYDCVAIHIYS